VKILLVEHDDSLDSRLQKEAKTLRNAGHEIHIMLTRPQSFPREEEWNGFPIHRWLDVPATRLERLSGNVYFRMRFRRPEVERAMKEAVRQFGLTAIHVVNLPLCRSALRIARETGVRVVADFHEYYPGLVPGWSRLSRWQAFKNSFLMSSARWKVYEREVLEAVDGVIVVSPRIRAMYANEGVNVEKVRVMELTPVLREFDAHPIREEVIKRYEGRFTISYVGLFFVCRGLEMVISAMKRIREAVPSAMLMLGGNGMLEDKLRKLVQEEGVTGAVDFPGWVAYEDLPSYLAASDIGICPLDHTPHHDVTLANKVFDHMAAGIPNLVSDCGSIKDIVEETGSGLVFRAGDIDDYVEKVVQLANDPELRKRLGENGRQAAETKYNWENGSGKKLEALYAELGAGQG